MDLLLILFRDSDCDICSLVLRELLNNPLNCDIVVRNVDNKYNSGIIKKYKLKEYPTSILVDLNKNKQIHRFIGFVDSDTINNKIKEYESKCMV